MFTYQGLTEDALRNKAVFAGKVNLVAVPALALGSLSLLWPGRRLAKLSLVAAALAAISRNDRVVTAYFQLIQGKMG